MALENRKFPAWGDTGERPPNGKQFAGGDPYHEEEVDYLWSNLHALEEDIIQKFNTGLDATTYKGVDINDDGGNSVDEADFAHNANATQFKGNDIDVDGDGIVNKAEETVRYKQLCNLPKTTLKDTDQVKQELYVPSGYEILFYEVGVEPNGAVVPSGLTITAVDLTNSVAFFNEAARFTRFTNPEATVQPGPIKVAIFVENSTGGSVNASGRAVYEIREQ